MGLARDLRAVFKRQLKLHAPALYTGMSRTWRQARRRRLDARYDWKIAIYEGPTLFMLAPVAGAVALSRHDLADIDAGFVADPFWVQKDGLWHLFFEIMDRRTGKGVIGCATSADLAEWSYRGVVLEDEHHLSYPHVFEDSGRWLMVPESQTAGAVRLYEAVDFPRGWRWRTTLLAGDVLLDATPFRHNGLWWLFTETGPHLRSDTLRLFGARELDGPWSEHPMSPIIRGDPRRARPAGRVVAFEGRVFRFAQDCADEYGTGIEAFEILALDPRHYLERPLGRVLGPDANGAFANGMHHIDALPFKGGWIACVDGR